MGGEPWAAPSAEHPQASQQQTRKTGRQNPPAGPSCFRMPQGRQALDCLTGCVSRDCPPGPLPS